MSSPSPSSQPAPRIPALDGLRGISIALVIFSHVLQTYGWTQSVPFAWRLVPGATGVSVFFAISGYLISTSSIRERLGNQVLGAWPIDATYSFVRRYVLLVGGETFREPATTD